MYLVALTGGIASGKSTVAKRLAEHGAVRIDADQLAREVVEPGTDALQNIANTFGEQLVLPDGSLDRASLGAAVFGHPEQLVKLNAIVHPAVQQLTRERIAEAEAADPDAIIVYDVPLLVEGKLPHPFEQVIVVSAPDELRIDRLITHRGMSRSDAERRIASQVSEAERLAIADIVIDSTGTLADTLTRADALWLTLRAQAEAKA
ncbi:dephospho-CoA kinase [Subtercola vilae]|uniref:Dephospho-CoA kinase n=1 Tax=Subtercola vilae TaxID=2056433 RepID=A0A4T2CAS3_9MICO|nr:dephospho-CoA kinase [Subtercola vilae]TIH40742.1 dephospho-CoA kinase [Subtercola vilae]